MKDFIYLFWEQWNTFT